MSELELDLELSGDDELGGGGGEVTGPDDSDQSWIILLEDELEKGCDFAKIRKIAGNRPLISDLRVKAWQILLGVSNKGDPFSDWDGLYNLPYQAEVRQEATAIAEKLGNSQGEKLGLVSDLESLLTLYCQTRDIVDLSDQAGWGHILQLLLVLKLPRPALYNTFFSLTTKYIPRGCVKDGRPFDLFRLLLLYHEPRLCALLDTHNMSPDTYAKDWFSSLFASETSLEVGLRLWDVYLQQADPFLLFFLALVILINAREVLESFDAEVTKARASESQGPNREELLEQIRHLPSGLEAEDIDDFCQLASHYSAKTPQSFRRDYHGPLFGSNLAEAFEHVSVHQLLCLPVSPQELLQSNKLSQVITISEFPSFGS